MPKLEKGQDPNGKDVKLEMSERRQRVAKMLGRKSYRQMAEIEGVSVSTIALDVKFLVETAPKISAAEYREEENARLVALLEKAQEMLDAPVGINQDPESKSILGIAISNPNQTIETIRKLSESRRKLLGTDAPVEISGGFKLEYTVNGVDPEELK